MAWIKDTVSDPPREIYLPPAELDGLVVKVVHDTEAQTWSIVYTELGVGNTKAQIEVNMNS